MFALADHVGTPADQVQRRVSSGGHLGLFMGHEALAQHWPPLLAEVRAHSVPRRRAAGGSHHATQAPGAYRALQPWSIVTGTPVNARPAGPGEERDNLGDLGRLDQPLDRVRREDHLFEHLVLGQRVHPCLVGDLLLDQRRADVARADGGRA